ncbi:MAG: hypothetical protein LBS62_10440 [Clostridiales bacterium]|jgi:predicted ester cyclase|nr:hypothetical protein [Clostridiales bacterium]
MAERNAADLFRQKRDYFKQILESMQGFRYSTIEEGVEQYVSMVNTNAEIFDKIRSIDVYLEQRNQDDPAKIGDAALSTEVERLVLEIKEIAERIIARDTENKTLVSAIMDGIRSGIKGVNDGRNLSAGYSGVGPEPSYFDKKK